MIDDSDSSPEELLLQKESDASSLQELEELLAIADENERLLLEAWREAFRHDPQISLRAVARANGWDPAGAEAVLKRLRRKLKLI